MSAELLLFVSSKCPHCPRAEEVAKRVAPRYYKYGLEFRKIRTRTGEGKKLSAMYGIQGTPTIILLDDKGTEIKRMVGVPREETMKASIERALGLRTSFFGKIFGKK